VLRRVHACQRIATGCNPSSSLVTLQQIHERGDEQRQPTLSCHREFLLEELRSGMGHENARCEDADGRGHASRHVFSPTLKKRESRPLLAGSCRAGGSVKGRLIRPWSYVADVVTEELKRVIQGMLWCVALFALLSGRRWVAACPGHPTGPPITFYLRTWGLGVGGETGKPFARNHLEHQCDPGRRPLSNGKGCGVL
jgi:hypothetical protein